MGVESEKWVPIFNFSHRLKQVLRASRHPKAECLLSLVYPMIHTPETQQQSYYKRSSPGLHMPTTRCRCTCIWSSNELSLLFLFMRLDQSTPMFQYHNSDIHNTPWNTQLTCTGVEAFIQIPKFCQIQETKCHEKAHATQKHTFCNCRDCTAVLNMLIICNVPKVCVCCCHQRSW